MYGGLCLCRGSTAAEAKNAQAADAQRLPIGQCPAGQANVTRPDTLREREIGIAALMGYLLQQLPGGAVRAGFQRITADLRFLFDIPRAAALMAVQVLRVVHRQCFIRKIHLYGVDVADLLQIHRKPLAGPSVCCAPPCAAVFVRGQRRGAALCR